MSNNSLAKIAGALAVICLYIFLFGFVKNIDDTDEYNVDQSPEFQGEGAEEEPGLYGDPVTLYRTGINAANDQKPQLADYTGDSEVAVSTNEKISETQKPDAPSESFDDDSRTVIITDEPSASTSAPRIESVNTTAGTFEMATEEYINTTFEPDELEELPEDYIQEETESRPESSVTRQIAGNGEKLTVIANGREVTDSALSIVSKIVQSEIGSAFNIEAIKAQAVATYTYVKLYNDVHNTPAQVIMSNVASGRVTSAVSEVLGEALYYNDQLIQAVYCASTAGYTASSKSVWGTDYPYLKSVATPLDIDYDSNYGSTKRITSSDMMERVLTTTGIELSGDPSGWFVILSHIDNVYVDAISIGGQTSYTQNGEEVKITGRKFRESVMNFDIKSACFEIEYSRSSDTFIITTYGHGHGVGMSQNGANTLAKVEGYDYKKILEFYYPGTVVR
ncbi:MAG: SpoIID/LytB domain-containing protein [Eubacterium sp.]|jgi:stage II sporulation protein D|nr:SpoIID/LytB domain-containing protein [Eubacterium sp.]